MRLLFSIGLAGALLAAAPAAATEFLFTVGGSATATGTLTVQDPINAVGGSFITAITGTYNGQSITGLSPVHSFGNNDNLLFVGQSPLLDMFGFTFTGAFGVRNFYYDVGQYQSFTGESGNPISFSIRQLAPGVPEPATWAMMLIGFGAMGVALRRRRTTVASIA